MKKYFISKYIAGWLLLLSAIIGFTACEADANDWDVDDSKAQMFTPVFFETAKLSATWVELRYSEVPKHRSYIIELSKDSLEFNSIEQTIEILVDDMEPDPASTSKRYLARLTGLDAESRYSARIKSTSDGDLPDSKWGTVTFKTIGEQIIERYSRGEDFVRIEWEAGLNVTHVVLSSDAGQQRIDLSAEDISAGTLQIDNLMDNTSYSLEIFNNNTKRGSISFKTLQKVSGPGTKYWLTGNENIVEYLNAITDPEVVLVLPAGSRYDISDAAWEIPSHITALTLWGLAGDEGQAYLKTKEIKIDNSVSDFQLWINNMEVEGTSASSDYLMNDNPSGTRTISSFQLTHSKIHTVRGVFRMRGNLTVDKLIIDNCIIDNIGSYGVLVGDAGSVSLGDIEISNTTIANVINASTFTFKGPVTSSLKMDYCTFYNIQTATNRYFVNFDGKTANIPATFTVSNSIFASPDESLSLRATNPKIESTYVFSSYKTSDYSVNSSYPLSGVNEYMQPSTDLFANPAESDFTIKDPVIGGESQPGDPRWW